MKKALKIIISSVFLLGACAPKPEERRFESPRRTFGPKSEDIDLQKRIKEFNKEPAALSWSGTISTSDFFEQAENLVILGELLKEDSLKNKGLQWIRSFYALPQSTSFIPVSQSPFASLAAAQAQEEVKNTLTEVIGDLKESRQVLSAHILNIGQTYPWPQENVALHDLLVHIENFTDMILASLGSAGLSPLIAEGVHKELKSQTELLFKDAKDLLVRLQQSSILSQSLDLVEKAIQTYEIELPEDLKSNLKQGRVIAKGLDEIHPEDPQPALTVLVDIWRMLSEEERHLYFGKVNTELHDFLASQDEKDLLCLRKKGCSGGFFKGITKKIFILPKIRKYGLLQLQREMNQKTCEYVYAQIEAFAREASKELPQIFAQKIDEGLEKKSLQLQAFLHEYGGYVKKLFAEWAQKNLPHTQGQVTGFEASHIKLSVSNSKPLSLESLPTDEIKASDIGTSMSANALLLEHGNPDSPETFQTALSQVNKLISIGGYRDVNNNLVPALLSPVEHSYQPLDMMKLSDSVLSYRIPDSIRLQDALHADEKMLYERKFSAESFANQIYGLSRMMRIMADWKETTFDKTLGKIKAQELTDEIQAEALNQALFPKDMLFTQNLGDVAVLLQNITKKSTPVFLLTLDKKLLWADQYSTSNETAIMAGIVDIRYGRKSNVVKTRDISKFILALGEFIEATDGVENTKSSILLEKDAQGVTPLQTLLEGRRDVKLLTVALANFLSNQLMKENSLLPSFYYLNKLEPSNNPDVMVDEQALAIRALLKASQITSLESYAWSAQEIYFAMNKHLYSTQDGFYANSDGSKLTFAQKVSVLRTLQELKPHLKKKSQAQLERIQAPWIQALRDLK